MKLHLLGLTAAFVLGLTGLAQAQGEARRPPAAPGVEGAAEERVRSPTVRPPAKRAASRAVRRPQGYRSARYIGGQGSTWKTGRDSHGFQGSFGGCQYRGVAGPGGYRLDQRC